MTAQRVAEVAHLLDALPIVWMLGMVLLGHHRAAQYWWLAVAFGVSWLADTAAHWIDPRVLSNIYQASQSALMGAVLLDRAPAMQLTIALLVVGVVGVLWEGATGNGVLLATVASGVVAGIAYERRGLGRLRVSLLVYFGAGGIGWLMLAARKVYCAGGRPCLVSSTSWGFWLLYHGTLVAGMGLFCWAALNVTPKFQLSTQARR